MRTILAFSMLLTLPLMAMAQQHGHTQMGNMMQQADTSKQKMQGMMQGGMMGGSGMMMGMGGMMGMQRMKQHMNMMMQNPMHRATVLVFTLPYLEEELGLTEEQVKQLKSLKKTFIQERKKTREAIKGLQQTLMEKMQDPNASLDDIRATMEAKANMKVNMHMLALETARKMKQVLTEEQRKKLKNLTPKQWMHAMMHHMPMMEMMQMMNMHQGMMMGMGGMMQGEGMMGGSGGMMMQQHNMQGQQNNH